MGDCSLDTSLRKELKAEKIKLFFFRQVNKFLSSKMVQSDIDTFSLWWKGNDYLSNYRVPWNSFDYLTDK